MRIDVERLRTLMAKHGVSQTELARLSNVSRATIARLLAEKEPKAQDGTEGRLCAALGLPAGSLNRDAVASAYLASVAKKHASLDLAGFGIIARSEPMPIARGYAPLTLEEWREDDHCERKPGRSTRPPRVPRRFTLGDALSRFHRLFLLGDPGSGKTTTLRYLAWAYTQGRDEDPPLPKEDIIPVFVCLAEWAEQLRTNENVDIVDAALVQMGLADSTKTAQWLRKMNKTGKLLLLLDGIDEVADPHVQSLILEKMRSMAEAYAESRIVVTSRIVGFETPSLGTTFDTLLVSRLDTKSIHRFVAEWHAFRHSHSSERQCAACERKAKLLCQNIRRHRQVRELAGNPMMLTILCLLHEAGAALPRRRWDLYEKIAEAFLFSWQETKALAVLAPPDHGLRVEDREVLWALESIALQMQIKDWTLVPRWWLSRHLSGFLQTELSFDDPEAREEADTLIWSLQQRSGLLVERGPDRFGFSHLAFQEYFAARAILASDDPVDALRPYFYHPRWSEVVRLAAARLDRRRAPQLVRMLLDDPDPTGRFLGRGLLAALSCLVDGASVHEKALLEELSHRCAQLGRTKWLGITLDVMYRLRGLRGTRLGDFAEETRETVLTAASEALEQQEFLFLLLNTRARNLPKDSLDIGDSGAKGARFTADSVVKTITVPFKDKEFPVPFFLVPSKWYKSWATAVLKRLSEEASPEVRTTCVVELGRFITHPKVRNGLVAALATEREATVRKRMVEVLAPVAKRRRIRAVLERMLTNDPDADVRGACAASLYKAAAADTGLRHRLVGLLCSDEVPPVRSGAARGLSRCASVTKKVRHALLTRLRDENEDDTVRKSCLWALEDVIPESDTDLAYVGTLLSGDPEELSTRVTAQLLARYAATGKVEWGRVPIDRIQEVLMSLKHPCPCALDALRSVLDARELRRQGLPREARIAQALSGLGGQIRWAFVFGSSARGEQSADSDIDLMVIGDISLRDVTPALKKGEQELGRQINPVIYTLQEWTARCRGRDPFVRNVLEGKKAFVLGAEDELTAMV